MSDRSVFTSLLRVMFSVCAFVLCSFITRAEYQEINGLSYELSAADHTATVCKPAAGVYDLQEVIIPESVTGADGENYEVTRINSNAFKGSNVTSISVSSSVISIGKHAFADCKSLTNLRFEKSATPLTIENFIFYGTDPTSLAEMHFYCGRELLIDSGCWLLQYSNTTYCELEGIEVLKDLYLGECKTLKDLVLHKGLKTISGNAFSRCDALHNVKIPEGVTSIEMYAFDNFTGLESITLPSTLLNIDQFYYCKSLADIYIYAKEPPTINGGDTPYPSDSASHGTVHVLAEALEAYKSSVWGEAPERYQIVGDLVEQKGVEIQLSVNGNGSLYVEGYEADKASSDKPQSVVSLPAGVINVVAGPDAGMEVGAFRVFDGEGNAVPFTPQLRGHSLVCEVTANAGTKIESEFREQSVRKLHVIMPQGKGTRMTLNLPQGAPYRFVYTSGEGMKLHSVLLDENEHSFTEGEKGENTIEVPDYEGEKTLRLVEVENGTITGLRSLNGEESEIPRLRYIGNVLTLTGLAEGESVSVFDTEGRLLHRGEAEDGEYSLPADLSGICLISTGTATLKVAL